MPIQWKQETDKQDKQDIGLLQSTQLVTAGVRQQIFLNARTSFGLEDNRNEDMRRAQFIGSYSPPSTSQRERLLSRRFLDPSGASPQSPTPLNRTSSRRIRPSQVHVSSWETSHSNETPRPTGRPQNNQPRWEDWMTARQMYISNTTEHSR